MGYGSRLICSFLRTNKRRNKKPLPRRRGVGEYFSKEERGYRRGCCLERRDKRSKAAAPPMPLFLFLLTGEQVGHRLTAKQAARSALVQGAYQHHPVPRIAAQTRAYFP